MIQPLKDADGNYIPLDTCELYEDDGTVVDITGFCYVPRVGVWVASTWSAETVSPNKLHLNNLAEEKDIDGLLKALTEIVENKKFRNILENRFAELKERCE